jgi:MYXO-CTERM domain-containing protein
MDPVAARLAPAFERATRGRGHMDVVTKAPDATPDAGDDDAGDTTPPPPPSNDSGGCATTPVDPTPGAALLLGLVAIAGRLGRRQRPRD